MLEALLNLDGNILLFIQEYIRNPLLTPILTFITSLGDGARIWIIASILLLIPKKTRRVGMMSGLALLGVLFVNNTLIKNIVARPRPYTVLENLSILIPEPDEFSFPSGHTASSFATAMVFYRQFPKKWGIPALILAALIGFSRLYVGVHYPTDVLGGIVSGTLIAISAEYIVLKVLGFLEKENESKRKKYNI